MAPIARTGPEPSVYALRPAEIVGDAFAMQYYTILQQTPECASRFYRDSSRLGRVESRSGVMGLTTTVNAIIEKIQSYGSLKADIKFIDAQESHDGGVIVLVTGSMVNKGASRRNFSQTFFLAPQDQGYYVLNDILRCRDDFPGKTEEQNVCIRPISSEKVAAAAESTVLSAETVGYAFARNYYMILQESPAMVYHFYQNISMMGRADHPGGVMSSTTTMEAINEKVQSYGRLKADIKFVDAQDSCAGGIIVLVTGSMVNKDGSRRNFTQTFFLAPQDGGYYVLDDIFRYVDDVPVSIEEQDGGIGPITPSQEEAPPVADYRIREQSNGEEYSLCENGELSVEDKKEEVEVEVEEEKPVAETVDETSSQDSWEVVECNAEVGDTAESGISVRPSLFARLMQVLSLNPIIDLENKQ